MTLSRRSGKGHTEKTSAKNSKVISSRNAKINCSFDPRVEGVEVDVLGESNVVNAHSIVASRADKGGVLLALVPLLKGGWGKEVMPK